jgi:hypothetical protein
MDFFTMFLGLLALTPIFTVWFSFAFCVVHLKFLKNPAPSPNPDLSHFDRYPETVARMIDVMKNEREPMTTAEIAMRSKVNRSTVSANLSYHKFGNKHGKEELFVHVADERKWGLVDYGPPRWRAAED